MRAHPSHPNNGTFSPVLFFSLCSACGPGCACGHGAQSDRPGFIHGCQLWPLEVQQPLPLLPEARIWEQLGQWVGTAAPSFPEGTLEAQELLRLPRSADAAAVRVQVKFAL